MLLIMVRRGSTAVTSGGESSSLQVLPPLSASCHSSLARFEKVSCLGGRPFTCVPSWNSSLTCTRMIRLNTRGEAVSLAYSPISQATAVMPVAGL